MFNTPQTQGLDDHLTPSICPVSRLIHHSPVPLFLLKTSNYTSCNTSLMLAVKGSNKRKHVAHQQKMLWVEDGQGE